MRIHPTWVVILFVVLLLPVPAVAQHNPGAWRSYDPAAAAVAGSPLPAPDRLAANGVLSGRALGVSSTSKRVSGVVDRQEGHRHRWLRWGLIGAGAGAVTLAVLGRMSIDSRPNPVIQDAALGALTGFVIVGGECRALRCGLRARLGFPALGTLLAGER
jgi:hypothetical protein